MRKILGLLTPALLVFIGMMIGVTLSLIIKIGEGETPIVIHQHEYHQEKIVVYEVLRPDPERRR
jgi:hypothetical protein